MVESNQVATRRWENGVSVKLTTKIIKTSKCKYVGYI